MEAATYRAYLARDLYRYYPMMEYQMENGRKTTLYCSPR